MAKPHKLSRRLLTMTAIAVVGAGLAAAFWPQPTRIDSAVVARGDLMVTIDEEGRTQVRETYVVSTPVAGQLLRVGFHPGDSVTKGQIVGQMRPTNPAALDARTLEQARAGVDAATAALRVAEADLNAAVAADDLAQSELERTQRLYDSGISSRAALDRVVTQARSATATRQTAEAAISMRQAEVANAQAQLISSDTPVSDTGEIHLVAPSDGVILRVLQESETTLAAGTPVLEIGNIDSDLEVVVDLVSSDAVQVTVGDRVLLDDWGGDAVLEGRVARIDPFGTTKYSALGVEEQRVGVVVDLLSPVSDRAGLGHGYRLEAKIVTWEAADILLVPASALFRNAGAWSVFAIDGDRAAIKAVEVGQSDGLMTEVTGGLAEGDQVVIYPPSSLTDGALVSGRE